MSSKTLLLPLYLVNKQVKTKKLLSEKTLIGLIAVVSLFSFLVIFKNLPSNTGQDKIEFLFKPQVDTMLNEHNHIIHINDMNHNKLHKPIVFKNVEIPQPVIFQTNVTQTKSVNVNKLNVDLDALEKSNHIKNVRRFILFTLIFLLQKNKINFNNFR